MVSQILHFLRFFYINKIRLRFPINYNTYGFNFILFIRYSKICYIGTVKLM